MKISLNDLGPRICIMGPSNSGKSTLAQAIGKARGHVPIHLDQLRHLPKSDWSLRPFEEFIALHDQAIEGDTWVIEGNYSSCLPQRLKKATGFILLDVSTVRSLGRYIARSFFETDRAGNLEGVKDHVKLSMVKHLIFPTRSNRKKYKNAFEKISLPKVMLPSASSIEKFYSLENLSRK